MAGIISKIKDLYEPTEKEIDEAFQKFKTRVNTSKYLTDDNIENPEFDIRVSAINSDKYKRYFVELEFKQGDAITFLSRLFYGFSDNFDGYSIYDIRRNYSYKELYTAMGCKLLFDIKTDKNCSLIFSNKSVLLSDDVLKRFFISAAINCTIIESSHKLFIKEEINGDFNIHVNEDWMKHLQNN